ncbi:MAG: ABC transporter permease [Nocardiopsaceae bacterium]|nr:ABC transporter permease [Nocardiopsaceae bacterium]
MTSDVAARQVSPGISPREGKTVTGRAISALRKSRLATAGAILVGLFIIMAIVGPYVAPYNPSATSVYQLTSPSGLYLLGTTQSGQDVLSQLLSGAGSSLELGFLTAAFATVLSVVVGVPSGYFSGVAGESLSSLANVFLVVPALPLIIVIMAYLPNRGVLTMAVVISVTGWAWGARQLRAQTMSLRRRDDIVAARAIGEKTWRIMFVEMMPSLLPIIISGFLFTTVFAIVTEASLAFLGLTDVSSWSWGTMLYWAQNDQAFTLGAWWWYIPPGLCIALVGMGLGLINFGIDELINPRLKVQRNKQRGSAR